MVATLNDDDMKLEKARQVQRLEGFLLFFLVIPLMFADLFPWLNPFGTIGIVVSLFLPYVPSYHHSGNVSNSENPKGRDIDLRWVFEIYFFGLMAIIGFSFIDFTS